MDHPSSDRPLLLQTLHELIRQTQAWALRRKFDAGRARELRRQAILLNHRYYLEAIPAYRRLAAEEGIGPLDDIEPIKQRLMLSADLFKSYDQRWLDDRAFERMNAWLSEVFHQRVAVDVAGVGSIDEWIERLAAAGIRLVYSSGTSGAFSFIPRDGPAWELSRLASTCYLTPLLLHEKIGTRWQRLVIGPATDLLSPDAFVKLAGRSGLPDFDALFLDFSHGRTGNQSLEQELAPMFRKHTFLYETDLSPTVLRLATRGPRTEEDRALLLRLQEVVVGRKAENYRRAVERVRASTAEGQKVFIFGTPFQCKELCEEIAANGQPVALRSGSLALFGGGWKSFTGEKIPRAELVALIANQLGLPADRILEGYSMVEINTFMLRCDHGRFHIPPLIEPVILDEALSPMAGEDLRGTFGFLDPLAVAYPGFIISGDEVHLVDGDCPCGLSGPAVLEIGRAQAREIKGCGGIMASVAA